MDNSPHELTTSSSFDTINKSLRGETPFAKLKSIGRSKRAYLAKTNLSLRVAELPSPVMPRPHAMLMLCHSGHN